VEAAYQELKERLGAVDDLERAAGFLSWDQHVKMPPRGAGVRAEQLATLEGLAHEALVADEIGALLDKLEGWAESQPYDSVEASLVRTARYDWDKARRVPAELRADMSRQSSRALPVWVEARQKADFSLFLPHLREAIALRHRYIECFPPAENPYDVLLDDFERGTTTAEVTAVFDRLKEVQIPLIAEVARHREGARPGRDGPYPIEAQQRFELSVIKRFGFDEEAWRIDTAVHPFASGTSSDDIRITTRYFETNLDGLFGTMHETGHGLYEHGVDRALSRTPLGHGVSLGLHESQSRMWENLVGRSLPFWRHFFPELRRTFPEALAGLELEDWYRAVNWVEPSLIRVEADEATYNLHVILRFELEQEMLAGTVDLAALPQIWNERMREYLGVEPPNDALGVLQDMHWAIGAIGYFPTYALGNVISAQIWETVNEELPGLPEQFEQGEFGQLREWLTDRLYRHGRKLTPKETLELVVGGPIDPEPYLRYLRTKVGALYGLPAETPR
jgi:carboxypeptidase Taq